MSCPVILYQLAEIGTLFQSQTTQNWGLIYVLNLQYTQEEHIVLLHEGVNSFQVNAILLEITLANNVVTSFKQNGSEYGLPPSAGNIDLKSLEPDSSKIPAGLCPTNTSTDSVANPLDSTLNISQCQINSFGKMWKIITGFLVLLILIVLAYMLYKYLKK